MFLFGDELNRLIPAVHSMTSAPVVAPATAAAADLLHWIVVGLLAPNESVDHHA